MKTGKEILYNNLMRSHEEIIDARANALGNRDNALNELETYYKKYANYLFSASKITKVSSNFRPVNNFPCIYSDSHVSGTFGQLDDQWYDLCLNIYKDIVSEMPQYAEEASKIFTFMGAIPEPLFVPPPSSYLTREEIGLPANPSESYLDFLENYVCLFVKENFYVSDNFQFKIGSKGNPGFPDIISDGELTISKYNNPYPEQAFKAFKKRQVQIQNKFFSTDEFYDCIMEGNLKRLANKFDMLFMYNDQHRGQPDRATKERFGYTYEVWSDHSKNHYVKADKFISLKYFSQFPGLFKSYDQFRVAAKKWRFVFAMSSSTNTVYNLILSSIRKNYGNKFARTFKCSDRITVKNTFDKFIDRLIERKISPEDYELIVFDVSNYDNSISPAMNARFTKGLGRVSELLEVFSLYNSMAPGFFSVPYVQPDPRTARNITFSTGNPMDLDSFAFTISPSGIADVSERAKIICSSFVLYYLCNGEFDRNRILTLLKGEDEDILLLNLGDNNAIYLPKAFRLKEKLERSDVFKIDVSSLGLFGGLVITNNVQSIEVNDSAVSTIIKILCPERHMYDPMRSSFALGYLDRLALSVTSKEIRMVLESIDRWMYNMFRCSSQEVLAKQELLKDNKRENKSIIYENLQKYVAVHGIGALSIYFRNIIDSGGDKLFYTDLYDECTPHEQNILDELFFTVIDSDDMVNILKAFKL